MDQMPDDQMPGDEFLNSPPDPTPTLLPPLLRTESGVERLQPLLELLKEGEGESPLMQLLMSMGEALALLTGIDQRLSRIESGLTAPGSSEAPTIPT